MYSALAKFYEILNDNCDQKMWSHYLISLLKDFCGNPAKLEGADLGCGTGKLTAMLRKHTGISACCDISSEMLAVATEQPGLSGIPLVCCGFESFKSPHKLDFLNIANDGINYVNPAKLKNLFEHLKLQLKSGGALLFDISSEHKLKNVLGNNLFFDDGDNLSMFWQSELTEDTVRFSLVFFEKTEQNLYKRSEEEQIQYIHDINDIKRSLSEAGFGEVYCFDGFTKDPVRSDSERIQFVAKRRINFKELL